MRTVSSFSCHPGPKRTCTSIQITASKPACNDAGFSTISSVPLLTKAQICRRMVPPDATSGWNPCRTVKIGAASEQCHQNQHSALIWTRSKHWVHHPVIWVSARRPRAILAPLFFDLPRGLARPHGPHFFLPCSSPCRAAPLDQRFHVREFRILRFVSRGRVVDRAELAKPDWDHVASRPGVDHADAVHRGHHTIRQAPMWSLDQSSVPL